MTAAQRRSVPPMALTAVACSATYAQALSVEPTVVAPNLAESLAAAFALIDTLAPTAKPIQNDVALLVVVVINIVRKMMVVLVVVVVLSTVVIVRLVVILVIILMIINVKTRARPV